jgi:hypothetical protein
MSSHNTLRLWNDALGNDHDVPWGVKSTGIYVGAYVSAGVEPGTNQITLQSTGTAPTGTGANVGHIYVDYETDDDELFFLSGTNGTVTQLTT